MKENKHPKIEITTSKSGGAFTEIFLDGHKIPGVRSYKLEHGAENSLPILTLDLNALNLSVDVPVFMIRDAEMGAMKIEFDDRIPVDEFGLKETDGIMEFARKTGIPAGKIAEFVKQNSNDRNKNG